MDIATLLLVDTHRHGTHYVTSSIKPEVHNASQRRQRRTEPRPQGNRTQNLVQRFQRYARRHKDRQTDRHIDRNTPLPYRGGVITTTTATATADVLGLESLLVQQSGIVA